MEFHIALTEAAPDPAVVQDALFDIDPTAVADLDMSGLVLRVSASATAADLIGILRQTGWTVTPEQVVQDESSHTGRALRQVLSDGRRNAYAAR